MKANTLYAGDTLATYEPNCNWMCDTFVPYEPNDVVDTCKHTCDCPWKDIDSETGSIYDCNLGLLKGVLTDSSIILVDDCNNESHHIW
jgi:hypothetical protein